jgi:hypothetical protein
VVRRRGTVLLLEMTASLFVVALVGASAAALLRAQARDVRMLYEERAAWEAAAGLLATAEANGGREGELPLGDWPGMENLTGARAMLTLRDVEPGLREAVVTVAWTGGIVEARAFLEAKP